jgi:ACS family glucarate transporter-like MFS transporter
MKNGPSSTADSQAKSLADLPFSASAPTGRRERTSSHILLLVMSATALTYLDRVNLSIAGHSIQSEMQFSTVTMGWVFSAFLLGYALMQVPGGWAADRFGPRRVLAFAVLWWSVFTAMTGLVPELRIARWMGLMLAFIVVRFLVGVGEAACSPAGNKLVANWLGSDARGFGASFSILGVGLGGAVTPPLISWVMQRWGWRSSFLVCAAIGVVFALVWYLVVRNEPNTRPQPEKESVPDKARRQPVPWNRLIRSRSVWGLVAGYFCQGYPIYFYYTWLFIYLTRVRGLTVQQGGVWGTLPYLSIAVLAPFGGVSSDFLSKRLGKKLGRRTAVYAGMFTSALLLWLGSRASNSITAVLFLAGASGTNLFAATTYWATCIDLTQEFTGSISGLMNTFGNLGGWLSPIVTAYVATRFGWEQALDLAAIVTLGSGLLFTLVDAGRCLDATPKEAD